MHRHRCRFGLEKETDEKHQTTDNSLPFSYVEQKRQLTIYSAFIQDNVGRCSSSYSHDDIRCNCCKDSTPPDKHMNMILCRSH